MWHGKLQKTRTSIFALFLFLPGDGPAAQWSASGRLAGPRRTKPSLPGDGATKNPRRNSTDLVSNYSS